MRYYLLAFLLICTPACADWHGHNDHQWGSHEGWHHDNFRGYGNQWYPQPYDNGGGFLGGLVGGLIGSLLRPEPTAPPSAPLK